MHRRIGLLAASIIISAALATFPAAAETAKPGVAQPPTSPSNPCGIKQKVEGPNDNCVKSPAKGTGGPDTPGKPPHK